MTPPLRLAIMNDYSVVAAGVAALLADENVDIVETGASLQVLSDVDIVLYDTFGQIPGHGVDLEDFVRDSGAKVVVYSWDLQPRLVAAAMEGGASGYLSKMITGSEIMVALDRIMNDELVVLVGDDETTTAKDGGGDGDGDWPGRSAGLSPREAEVLALITRGLSNQEIAARTYLSINSIKTFIRSAYRKIGVSRRTQAVLWGIDNGFQVDVERTIHPPQPGRPYRRPFASASRRTRGRALTSR